MSDRPGPAPPDVVLGERPGAAPRTVPPAGVSPERSRVMRSIKSRDTGPERRLRRILTDMGLRYRLHRRDLPGSPDLVFAGRRVTVFVHGCFWHGHDCPRGAREPKTNVDYWRGKIARNRQRDANAIAALKTLGWRPLVVWECELTSPSALVERLAVIFGRSAAERSDPG